MKVSSLSGRAHVSSSMLNPLHPPVKGSQVEGHLKSLSLMRLWGELLSA